VKEKKKRLGRGIMIDRQIRRREWNSLKGIKESKNGAKE
jgi:hypothetical protein